MDVEELDMRDLFEDEAQDRDEDDPDAGDDEVDQSVYIVPL